jgi:signal peptidase I
MAYTTHPRIREEVDRLGVPPQDMLQRAIAQYDRREGYKKQALGVLAGLVVATAWVVIITNLWLGVFQINGSSMSPLLTMNQIVIALRTNAVEQNDVIAFSYDNKLNIKRVIALSGDKVGIDGDGIVSVNGEVLDEPYVTDPSLGNCDITFPYTVPPGTVFVLGDNRASSLDSRDSQIGAVDREQIVGKVKFNVWPLSQLRGI